MVTLSILVNCNHDFKQRMEYINRRRPGESKYFPSLPDKRQLVSKEDPDEITSKRIISGEVKTYTKKSQAKVS